MKIVIIFLLGLAPSLLSIWLTRRGGARTQARLDLAREAIANRRGFALDRDPNLRYIEGIGYIIGDITCGFNARSRYLRCTVNPLGPCETCRQYEPLPSVEQKL